MKKNNTRKTIANIIYVIALVMIAAGLLMINSNSELSRILMCAPCVMVFISNSIKRSIKNN